MTRNQIAVPEPDALHPIVELILSEPGMAERLLAEHADDGSGRCRCCSGGNQTPRFPWPCTLHYYADLGQRLGATAGRVVHREVGDA